MTVAALSYFTDMNADIAIIEVGMGGLWMLQIYSLLIFQ